MHLNSLMCLLTVYLCHLKMEKRLQYLGNKRLISSLGQTHLLSELLLFKVKYYFSILR